ncbi:hypothetical protein G6F31_016312 [Rhizopus arrhizus]|nr:hypothetical protein G6F31_016312 [Rhizopus arrhizus]
MAGGQQDQLLDPGAIDGRQFRSHRGKARPDRPRPAAASPGHQPPPGSAAARRARGRSGGRREAALHSCPAAPATAPGKARAVRSPCPDHPACAGGGQAGCFFTTHSQRLPGAAWARLSTALSSAGPHRLWMNRDADQRSLQRNIPGSTLATGGSARRCRELSCTVLPSLASPFRCSPSVRRP